MTIAINEKPLMLSRLISLLQESLRADGDCGVRVGCHGEGIGGDPVILRNQAGIEVAFNWVFAEEGDVVLWGNPDR